MQAKAWVGRGAGAVAMAALVACGGGGDDKTATAAPAQLSAGADGLKKALRVFTPTTPRAPRSGAYTAVWRPVALMVSPYVPSSGRACHASAHGPRAARSRR